MSAYVLSSVDYIIFCLTLSVSAIVGIYFGCFGSKQKTATEYLYGNRKMKAIPVGLSLYSSAISAVTIVGVPAEVYVFGTQYVLIVPGIFLSLFITWQLILPVFCGNLELSSPYEYFELRFSSTIRLFASLLSVLHATIYMPVVLYATVVSFSTASNIALPYCTTVVGGVCVVYTVVGGFKSVIWTDTIQATLMLCSYIFLMVVGIVQVGGFFNLWNISQEGSRIQFFNMDPDPFVRLTFWSACLGSIISFATHSGCSAGALQRYMSLTNENQARISTAIGALGAATISLIGSVLGLCMYVYFKDCDPIANNDIPSPNALLSYYLGPMVNHMQGFSGFFLAGILSAGLSTMSAELNTVSGLIYHDFIRKIFKKQQLTEIKGAIIMKIIVLLNGLFYLAVAPFLANSKYLYQLSQVILAFTYGAKLGLMILGTTFPICNSMGALWGIITSLLITGWISVGSMYSEISSSYALPITTENCSLQNVTDISEFTTTYSPIKIPEANEPFILYHLSYMYFFLLGTIICVVVGLAVSYATGAKNGHKVDPKLIIPRMRPKSNGMALNECLELQLTERNSEK